MSEFLFQYNAVSPATWAYLSSLLLIGLFFKFNRVWSVRNLDLFLLILLAPGLLFIHYGELGRVGDVARDSQSTATPASESGGAGEIDSTAASEDAGTTKRSDAVQRIVYGYRWLFVVSGLWLVRLLLDPTLVRRPLLMPNLSVGGLAFMGCAMFIFLVANVVAKRAPEATDMDVATHAAAVLNEAAASAVLPQGPGYALLNVLPAGTRKTIAVVSLLAIVVGIVLVTARHFGNATNGFGAAMLYLMLPYTTQTTGQVDHSVPAALMIWAVFCYRLPLLSGIFLGAAGGSVYYPFFLLPLWISFYWRKGLGRFLFAVAFAVLAMTLALLAISDEGAGLGRFVADLQRMFGILVPKKQGLVGIWDARIGGWDPVFRLPILAAFVALAGSLFLWPPQKNLGTLLSCSAAVMLASQFWHGYGGGTYMAWYLPLTLLAMFRPNLEDRIAAESVRNSLFARRSVTREG